MPVDHIRYDLLTQQALRAVVRRVLGRRGQDRQPARRASFLRHVRHARAGREAVVAPARAVSGRDDHRAAAPVLGSRGERHAFRGRAVVQRHLRKAARAARGRSRASSIRRCSSACSSRPSPRRPRAPPRSAAEEPAEEARRPQAAAQAGRRRARRPRSARRRPAALAKAEPAKAEPREAKPPSPPLVADSDEEPEPDKPSGGAEVVRLDRFRKK